LLVLALVGVTGAFAAEHYNARIKKQEEAQKRLERQIVQLRNAGSQELVGPIGRRGASGGPGAIGATGAQGLQGEVGLQGVQGVQGEQGSQGLQGADGATGVQGPEGVQGLEGLQGEVGLQGAQGVQGEAGPQGVAGPQGEAGPQGPQGATGVQGAMGPQGPQGPAGADGLDAPVDTDSTMAANSDVMVPSQKAVKTALSGKAPADLGTTRPFIVPSGHWWLTTIGVAQSVSFASPSSNAVNSNNYVRYTPFYLAEDTPVDGMAIQIVNTNPGAGAVVGLAIYDANPSTGMPRNVMADAGTASINTAGMKTMTFSAVSLPVGYYWAALTTRGLDTGGSNPTFAAAAAGQAASEPAPLASNNMFPYLAGVSASWPVANPSVSVGRTILAVLPHIWLRKG
jgi:hypothetical protein